MSDIIKKTILAGLGLFSLTKEKAEKMVQDLVKRGEVAKSDGAKIIKGLLKKAEEEKKVLEGKIEEKIRQTLKRLDIPTRKEVEELKKKVAELSKHR